MFKMLATARVRRFPLPEIVLWTTASQHPSESQTSECSDLLSRSRATFVIVAQRQPGKLQDAIGVPRTFYRTTARTGMSGYSVRRRVHNFFAFCSQIRGPRNKVDSPWCAIVRCFSRPFRQFWFRTFRRRNISTRNPGKDMTRSASSVSCAGWFSEFGK